MSSETSTDALPTRRDDPSLEPWQLFTLAGLMGATVVVFLSRGQTPAGIILLSLIIFAAAVVGVAAWRTLAPFTQSDRRAAPAVLGGRTRAALEREKTLTLRAIKDLEFDRAMGKISEADFAEMGTRLRARAARLIAQLDTERGYREQIERDIARRIGADPTVHVPPLSPASVPARDARTCRSCGKSSDLDARFCKHCGSSLDSGR
jgi:hypothetical protein